MTVYARHLNGRQRSLAHEFEAITGFELMFQEDIDAGRMTFYEAWQMNLDWLEDVVGIVSNLSMTGAGAFVALAGEEIAP